jgi:hypothetical protein
LIGPPLATNQIIPEYIFENVSKGWNV